MKQLLKKIAAIGTSALIVGISAGAAVAANYPNPFISGDVAVVYGADSIDTVQAMNINLDLASRGGTSDSGSSVVGDAWQVKTSSDKFEIGESIYDVEKYIDDDSLPLLAAGEIVNSKGTATYDQYLYFSDVSSSMINYTEDDDVDLVGDYFFIANGHNIAKYTLDFNTNLESDITSGTLDDIEDEVISILGKDYTITTATNGSGGVELTLMSGAETATITSGEELPPLGGYTISAVVSSSTAVQFTVDGKTIDKMNKGEIEPIPGTNDYIAVTDISYESYSGGLHQATFWIGADKLLLRNTQDLEVNAETINGATVTINHTESGGDISITEIVVNLTAQDDYLVPVNGKLSAEISTEGDEPQILIGQNWDIEFKGYEAVETETVSLDASESDRQYKLTFTNLAGVTAELPVFYSNETGIYSGDSADKKLTLTPTILITKNDYFILNTADPVTAGNNAKSYIVQYKGADKVTTTNPKVTFDILGIGSQEVSMSSTALPTINSTLATLKVGGGTFTFTNASTVASSDCNIYLMATDYADGVAANGTAVSQYLRTKYNALINITDYNHTISEAIGSGDHVLSGHADGPYNASLTAPWAINITVDDTSRDDDDVVLPEMVYRGLFQNATAATSDMVVSVTKAPAWVSDPADNNHATFRTEYGVLIDEIDGDDSPPEVTLTIPESIMIPLVYLSSGEISVNAGSAGGAAIGNVVYKDSEKASWSAKNVIIVGGSCINTAAAEALGVVAGACGSAFTDATGVESGQFLIQSVADKFTTGKIALVVAGYNVDDTVAGATYLTTQTVNTDAGTKYKGTSSTSATLVVE